MRTHSWYSQYEFRYDLERFRRIAGPSHLAACRLEPVYAMRYSALLDVIFERDGAFASIPFAVVDGLMLLDRESDPIIWPRWTREALGEDIIDDLNEQIYPWLRSRVLARFENEEITRYFNDDPAVRSAVERARRDGLLGAATLLDVMRSLAPATYALRFIRNRDVAIGDPNGANGAALLSGRARRVDADLGDAGRLAFAKSWFSALPFGSVEQRTYDVAIGLRNELPSAPVRVMRGLHENGERIVAIARPVPAATMVSFDDDDSTTDAALAVDATPGRDPHRSAVEVPAAIGGSGGRIALVTREDLERLPDADTDLVRVLRDRLEKEGFTVSVHDGSAFDPSEADLVHVVGHRNAARLLPPLERAVQRGIPIVVMPHLDDSAGIGPWGTNAALAILGSSSDDTTFEQYLRALGQRRLSTGVALPAQSPLVNEELRRVLDLAGSVIVTSPAEERLLRDFYGYGGSATTVPALFSPGLPTNIEAIAGCDDFVLLHAPIEPRSNVFLAMLASARQGLPLVIAGPVANVEYYLHLVRNQSDTTIVVPERQLSHEDIAGLYANARVFVDASWTGAGLSRVARAASFGASLVVTQGSLGAAVWPEVSHLADPCDVESLASAMRGAWDVAPSRAALSASLTAERCAQGPALSGVVTAYNQALIHLSASAR